MLLKPRLWIALLVCLFGLLQYRLWIADGGIPSVHRLQAKIIVKNNNVQELQAHNSTLEAEVADLKSGNKAIAGWARSELGMIGKGEDFYLLVHSSNAGQKPVHSTPQ